MSLVGKKLTQLNFAKHQKQRVPLKKKHSRDELDLLDRQRAVSSDNFAAPHHTTDQWSLRSLQKPVSTNSLQVGSSSQIWYAPEQHMKLVDNTKEFADRLLHLKKVFLYTNCPQEMLVDLEEDLDPEQEKLWSSALQKSAIAYLSHVVDVIKKIFEQFPLTNSSAVMAAITKVMFVVRNCNYSLLLIEFRESVSAPEDCDCDISKNAIYCIEKLAAAFDQRLSDMLQGDIDNYPMLRQSASQENLISTGQSENYTEDDVFARLESLKSGIEIVFDHAKSWTKYAKEISSYVEKRNALVGEFSKKIVNLAGSLQNVISEDANNLLFRDLHMKSLDRDIEYARNMQKSWNNLQHLEFVQLNNRRVEHERKRKILKDAYYRIFRKMNDASASVKSARKAYESKKLNLQTASKLFHEVDSTYSLSSSTGSNHKKRKAFEEAQHKALEADRLLIKNLEDARSTRKEYKNYKKETISATKDLVRESDKVMKRVTTNYFNTLYEICVNSPTQIEHLKIQSEHEQPGSAFLEYVQSYLKQIRNPRVDSNVDDINFDSLGFRRLSHSSESGSEILHHHEHGDDSDSLSGHSFKSIDSPYSSPCQKHLDEQGLSSSAVVSKSGGSHVSCDSMHSAPTSASISSSHNHHQQRHLHHCHDNGPTNFDHAHNAGAECPAQPKSPSQTTTSPATTISLPTPSAAPPPAPPTSVVAAYTLPVVGLSDTTHLFRNVHLSPASKSHCLRRLRTPSRCHHCSSFVYFHGAECRLCGLTSHKKCLEVLAQMCQVDRMSRRCSRMTTFGVPIANQTKRTMVPYLVRRCIGEIDRYALGLRGIYRVSAVKSRVEALCQKFETGNDNVDLSDYHSHVIANVLKLYLRQLPEPLLTFTLYPELIQLAKDELNKSISSTSEQFFMTLKSLIFRLPKPNFQTCGVLMRHLNIVSQNESENQMTASNLGIVFGPTLLRNRTKEEPLNSLHQTLEDTPCQTRLIELMIINMKDIFFPDLGDDLTDNDTADNEIKGNTQKSESKSLVEYKDGQGFVQFNDASDTSQNENSSSSLERPGRSVTSSPGLKHKIQAYEVTASSSSLASEPLTRPKAYAPPTGAGTPTGTPTTANNAKPTRTAVSSCSGASTATSAYSPSRDLGAVYGGPRAGVGVTGHVGVANEGVTPTCQRIDVCNILKPPQKHRHKAKPVEMDDEEDEDEDDENDEQQLGRNAEDNSDVDDIDDVDDDDDDDDLDEDETMDTAEDSTYCADDDNTSITSRQERYV